MAGFTGASPIVTDGLVFAVDPANYESYPGSGNTWTDLVSGITGTLTNNPTYSSNNGGLIVCDGTDDYIDFDSFESYVPTTEGTINTFVRITDLTITSGEKFIMNYKVNGANQINIMLKYTGGSAKIQWRYKAGGTAENRNSETSNFSTSDFYLLSITYSVTNNRMRAYSNGVQISNDLSIGGTWEGGTADFQFGGHNGNKACPIELAQGSVYNRELSATEILQNYNALKPRFNL